MNIQEIFDSQKTKINIPAGEYKGPLVINKECVINGNNATVWTKESPVVIVEADNVIVKNLKAELTKGDGKNIAVICKHKNVAFDNFEVFGEIEFYDKTSTRNDVLRVINLGEFKSNNENIFVRKIVLDSNAIIENNISGLNISPQKLSAGENILELKISPLKNDTVIYGSFILKTDIGVVKRIYVSGISKDNAKKIEEKFSPKNDNNASVKTNNSNAKIIAKGERIILHESEKNYMVFSAETNLDKVDPYVFLLYENNKSKGDDDIIFFGNPASKGIFLEEKNSLKKVNFDLKNAPQEIKKIAVTFAVYDEGGNKNLNFHKIKNPEILFYVNDKLKYSFPLNLTLEKAINAVEIYRHKGIWKANFIGAGFNEGIRGLCKMFGIDVK